MIDLTVELPIRIALLEFEGLGVDDHPGGHEALVHCGAAYRAAGATAPGAVPGVQVARELFRALGIDPTKRRPSSEALLNRALKDKPMPRVNSLVDVGNWCSLDFLLPLGLYDRARLAGTVTLRQGRAGEAYDAIGDKTMNVEGRYVLVDDAGPFGSPITDSRRTCVTPATTDAAILVYAPASYDAGALAAHAATMAARVTAQCGGATVNETVVTGG